MNGQQLALTDLRNAGANVVDQEVVIDGALVSSRSPADPDAFCSAVVERFAKTGAGAS
jgi:protease I